MVILRRAGSRAGCFLVESSSRSSFLFVRDLFRKPVPTFRDHALLPSCHSVNAFVAPRDVTAPQPPPWLDFIQRNASSAAGRRGAMVNNQGHNLSCTDAARRATTWPANA